MENIFYFRRINAIGGTEQFLCEIAKKYHDRDITVFYKDGDFRRLEVLMKYVRCVRWTEGMKIKCRRAFFNYDIDIIDSVTADEYIFISHAIYQELKMKPPIQHPKLTRFIGVSQFAVNQLDLFADQLGVKKRAEKCYNPLSIEKPQKVIKLVSATRLNDHVKGGQRTLQLINALDQYCHENNRQYLWTIFTNKTHISVTSPNVCLMQGRVDIRPYIADADYLIQLSNDMETYCYSINEALCYGVPVITTPLSIMKELPVTDEMHIECSWNMDNAQYVAQQIFERDRKKFTYVPPEDGWSDILGDAPSTYEPIEKENGMGIKVRALDTYQKFHIMDADMGTILNKGFVFEVSPERLDVLLGNNKYGKPFVEVIEEEKAETPVVEETPKKRGRKPKKQE